jgi:hypothetical protein
MIFLKFPKLKLIREKGTARYIDEIYLKFFKESKFYPILILIELMVRFKVQEFYDLKSKKKLNSSTYSSI